MPRGRRAGDDGAYGCSVRAYGSDAAGLAGTEKMQKKKEGMINYDTRVRRKEK